MMGLALLAVSKHGRVAGCMLHINAWRLGDGHTLQAQHTLYAQ